MSSKILPKSSIQIKVIIVGAGLGGLAASIGLSLAGHEVIILEQAPALGEVGAGIQIPPNSTNILKSFGISDELLKACHTPRSYKFRRWEDNELLNQSELHPYTTERYGAPYLHIHRADFHRILYERAKQVGVNVILDSRIAKVNFEENSVYTTTGKCYNADVIIGADGLKSQIRQELLNKIDLPHNTGDIAWRALVDINEAKKHQDLKFIWEEPNINFFLGPGIHVVVYLLNTLKGETINIVVLSPDTLPENVNVEPAKDGEIVELLKDWNPQLKKLATLIHNTAKWRLQNSREMDSWVHHSANVALLGDSCHATLPYLAQGAAQAVEDAAVLSSLFGRIQSKDQIHGLLKCYENIRKSRTTQVVQGSTKCREYFHLEDGDAQRRRDEILKGPPVEGYPNRWADPVFQPFLFGYDAFEEADKGWDQFLADYLSEQKVHL